MRHPILTNRYGIQLYLLAWLAIMAVHIVLNIYNENAGVYQALVDSVVSDALFAGMALGLWYPIRYLNIETQPIWTFLLRHLGMSVTFLFLFSSTISCSLEMLVDQKEYLELFYQSLPWRIMTSFLFYCMAVMGYYLHIYYFSFKQKQLVEAELKSLVKETELNLLKSQLNPHFIFNSLNSISSLTISDPPCAQEMIVKLSSYIRYALKQKGNELVNFSEEIENARLYLKIEKVRFGDKLTLQDNCSVESLQALVPNMLLQPLLENAIKHGVYESIEPVYIELESKLEGSLLNIRIRNNYETEGRMKQGNGIGLRNIRERLSLIYNEKSLIRIKDAANTFDVEMVIPQNSII